MERGAVPPLGLLSLTQVSSSFGELLAQYCNYKLFIPSKGTSANQYKNISEEQLLRNINMAHFTKAISTRIHEITLDGRFDRLCINEKVMGKLLFSKSLKKATLTNRAIHVRMLNNAISLEDVHVYFTRGHWGQKGLFRLLSANPLRKLSLSCGKEGVEQCESEKFCVSYLFDTVTKCEQLSSFCPSVEELEINCRCKFSGQESVDQFLGSFRKLKRVKIARTTNEEKSIEYLRNLESVVLVEPPEGISNLGHVHLAAQIGPAVTEIVIPDLEYPFTSLLNSRSMDIMGLRNCFNLKALHLVLERETEYQFPVLPGLEFLKLDWMNRYNGCSMSSSTSTESIENSLSHISTSFPCLKRLRIGGLSANVELLEDFIGQLRSLLIEFHLSMHNNGQSNRKIIATLLSAVLMHCPNLSDFKVSICTRPLKICWKTATEISWEESIRYGLNILKERVPDFKAESVLAQLPYLYEVRQ